MRQQIKIIPKLTILFCAALFLTAGCAQVPIPATFPYSSKQLVQSEPSYFREQQLQSATHWQLIAKMTAERLSSNPDLLDLLKSQSDGYSTRISVQNSDNSPFGQAFRELLITELMKYNFLLSDATDGPVNIHWSTQLVSRNKERPRQFLGVPAFVLQAAGFILVGNGWATSDFRIPRTEVILTTRVTIGKDSVANTIKSYNDIFYINNGDWINYCNNNDYINYLSDNVFSRSIAGQDEAWRKKFAEQGRLSQ